MRMPSAQSRQSPLLRMRCRQSATHKRTADATASIGARPSPVCAQRDSLRTFSGGSPRAILPMLSAIRRFTRSWLNSSVRSSPLWILTMTISVWSKALPMHRNGLTSSPISKRSRHDNKLHPNVQKVRVQRLDKCAATESFARQSKVRSPRIKKVTVLGWPPIAWQLTRA